MAEEEKNQDAQMERFQALLREEIKREVETVFKSQPRQTESAPKPETEEDIFRKTLSPYIEPGLREASLKADAAQDEARFYRKNPNAALYEEQIEATFSNLMKAGRPMSRQDIADYIIGKELREKPEEVFKRMKEKEKAELEKAQSAVDIGVYGLGKTKTDPRFENFGSKSVKEMEEALEGFTF